jgi:hypothetical protein
MVKHRSPAERIVFLQQQSEQIAARLKALQAKQDTTLKKAEARRAFLLGACVASAIEADAALKSAVQSELDKFLTHPRDRALFVDLLK